MPDFASLKEAFNKAFNKMFYREAIVFLRDGNLWVMDSDGKNDKQLTKEGVGSFSVSMDGKRIVYEEKGNCYISSLGGTKKLVETNDCYSPVISPDGNMVAFFRTEEKLSDIEAQQMSDPDYYILSVGGTKKSGLYIFDLKTSQHRKIVGELPFNLLPKDLPKDFNGKNITQFWKDGSLLWSQDGKKLYFERNFFAYRWGDSYILNLETGDIEYLIYHEKHHDGVYTWAGENIVGSYDHYPYIMNIKNKKDVRENLEKFYHGSPFSYLDIYGEKVLFFTSDYLNGLLFVYDVKTSKYHSIVNNINGDIRASFSPDGKWIAYTPQDGLWVIDIDGNNKKQLTTGLPVSNKPLCEVRNLSWNMSGERVLLTVHFIDDYDYRKRIGKSNIWLVNSDGSNLNKIAENAQYTYPVNYNSPKWTSMPRITFISPNTAKIIILVAIALTGLLFLFGMVLISRKAVKAVVTIIPKSTPVAKTKGIFCTQCGTQNPESASFCKKCGQRLKE
jgi:Tol biopolymer transport system component